MRMGKKQWLSVIGAPVALVLLLVAFGFRNGDKPEYLTAKVQKGEIQDSVDLTGTVNAVVTVQVGSQVSGTIAKLNADFNSRVTRGEVIALIDPSLFQGALLQATADVETARANYAGAQANAGKEEATVVQTEAAYKRTELLEKQHLEPLQALELAKANYDVAKAQAAAAIANVAQAKAQIKQKEAALSVARTNLDHTVIRSPIDGIVVARNVDVGQTVAASLQAPTVFTIAQDLTKMQLYAKTDESDVGRIRVGQKVSFKVDAFPTETFQGVVRQMRMNATSVQNVVTYDTIIDFQNPGMKLFPGMTAYVTIPIAIAQEAVKLPNAALRYKPPMPPETIQGLYAKYGIEASKRGEAGTTADDDKNRKGSGTPSAGTRSPAALGSIVVWTLRNGGTPEPVQVEPGITDHAYTEVRAVLQGSLKPGDEVITTTLTAKASASQGAHR